MGRLAIDMIGKKFGRWTVIERAGSDKYSKPVWLCECKCGCTAEVNGASLRRGDSTSCGCYMREVSTTHGMYKSRLNKTYRGLKQRCYNPKNTRYSYYGGRGIKMCSEWLGEDGPTNFINWALKNGYTDELTIDRVDNSKDYSPSNCRWVTMETQARNRRVKVTNKTGVTGVSRREYGNWRVTIRHDGRNKNLGTFKDFDEAVKVRKDAELLYWGKGGGKNGS